MDSKNFEGTGSYFATWDWKKSVCWFVFLSPRMNRNLSFTILFLSVYRHIENWTGLQTLRDVDMELYTGLQRLWVLTPLSGGETSDRHFTVFQSYCVPDLEKDSVTCAAVNPCFPLGHWFSPRDESSNSAYNTSGCSCSISSNASGFSVRYFSESDTIPANSLRRWQGVSRAAQREEGVKGVFLILTQADV